MHYVKCSHCNCEYKIDPEFLGKSIKCQECNNSFKASNIYQKKRKPTLGELAVTYKIITKEQLGKALALQKAAEKKGKSVPLADIFIQKKMMTTEQLGLVQDIDKYLELRVLDKQFGKIAIKKGILSDREIKLALSVQAISFKKNKYCRLIGDILVESGVMDASQKNMILEEQKRMDQMLPKKDGKVVDAETDAGIREHLSEGGLGFREGIARTISDIKSGNYREVVLRFTQTRALIVIGAVILITVGLTFYASTLKPKNYRQIGKDGVMNSLHDSQKTYSYPIDFSTTLKDYAYFKIKFDIEFYDIKGFEELDIKLPRIKHALNLVYSPRSSNQIRAKSKIPRTLKKILQSQIDVEILNIKINDYVLTKPDSGEQVEPTRELPDFSFK